MLEVVPTISVTIRKSQSKMKNCHYLCESEINIDQAFNIFYVILFFSSLRKSENSSKGAEKRRQEYNYQTSVNAAK